MLAESISYMPGIMRLMADDFDLLIYQAVTLCWAGLLI